jgi:hypothetical protein
MADGAEELIGRPVDFVLLPSLEKFAEPVHSKPAV